MEPAWTKGSSGDPLKPYNPTPNSNPLTPRYILCKMRRIQPLVRITDIMGNPWHAQAQTAVKVKLNYTVA